MSNISMKPVAANDVQNSSGVAGGRYAFIKGKVNGVRPYLKWTSHFVASLAVKKSIMLFAFVAACVFSFASTSAAEGHAWAYDGEFGPENWHKADPAYYLCKEGKNQSPVDLRRQYDVRLPLLTPAGSRPATEMKNTGHTIEIPFPEGNTLTFDGAPYTLQQVHFHAPSENTLAGERFPMEAHFVHRDKLGNLLVLALFFKEGRENPDIAALWDLMPQKPRESVHLQWPFYAKALLPRDLGYMYFNGSLTTPPCSEGVRWCVLKTPMTASKAQAEKLLRVMGGPNNRPLQLINARPTLF